MHNSRADKVIYRKLYVWLPNVMCDAVIRQRGINTPWTVYWYLIYILIILWQPEGNHYITWDEYLMTFDYLIEELSFLWPTNIAENAYISDIENTFSFIELLANTCNIFVYCFVLYRLARDISTYIVILWHCKYIQYVKMIPPPPWTYRFIQHFEWRLHIRFHKIISVWPFTIVSVLLYSLLPWQKSIYSL